MSPSDSELHQLMAVLDRRRFIRPAVLVVLAFLLGASLLGLAGWFIASSAVAGLAVLSTFSFLFPSAGVQALAWARTAARYGERIYTHDATLDLAGSLRADLFARALRLPRERVAELRSGELLSRIMVDSDAVENLLLRSMFPAVGALAALVATTVFLLTMSLPLGILVAGGLAIAGAALAALANRHAGRPAQEQVAVRAQARRGLIETIEGLQELRSFGLERRAADELGRQLDGAARSRQRLSELTARAHGVGVVLADLVLLAVLAVAAGLIGTRALPVPAITAISLVTIAAFEPILALPGAVTARARARAAAARLLELFRETDETGVAVGAPLPQGDMFELTLAAHGTELTIGPGDTILLTGASGSGKTTLLNAIAGRSTPGIRALINGVNVTEVAEDVLVTRVTRVAQDAHVFDGTIRENLALADPNAGEERLWQTLAAAGLRETVLAFPAGLDTPVGPDGNALSGGQRRRLSVAQGLLRDTPLLMLDEPTEGLDADTATRVLAAVRELRPERTLIIALHDRQSLSMPWQPDAIVQLGERSMSAS
jgi:ATP-binding cassette, subfamily C, bacterial CydC